jgi:hypothetical protein
MRKAYIFEFHFKKKREKRNRSKLFSVIRSSESSNLSFNKTVKAVFIY